jgi:hypothetical protein
VVLGLGVVGRPHLTSTLLTITLIAVVVVVVLVVAAGCSLLAPSPQHSVLHSTGCERDGGRDWPRIRVQAVWGTRAKCGCGRVVYAG